MHLVSTLLLLLFRTFPLVCSYYISEGQCTLAQKREALLDANSCQLRPTLVNLKNYLSHLSYMNNVIQVIPEYKTVSTCGGSCELISHGCMATSTRSRSINVTVVRKQNDHSQNEVECGVIVVEEDVACSCNCQIQERHCSVEQYYDRGSCQCLCKDQLSRNKCISRGMEWDPLLCMCTCPESVWKICSTGYYYDSIDTCQCVPNTDKVWLNGDWDWYYNKMT